MLSIAAGYGQGSASDNWKSAFSSSGTFVMSEDIEKNAPQSILLIKENHASVKTQQQLAALLEALYQDHKVEAILMEGSYGPIVGKDLREAMAKYGQKTTTEFWKAQLDSGGLAAYEYLVLTRDGITVWGIENMDAKRKNRAGAERRGTLAALDYMADTHKRALALAKQASATLSPNGPRTSGSRRRTEEL